MNKKIIRLLIALPIGSLVGCAAEERRLEDYARAWQAYSAGDERQALHLLAENERRRPRLALNALLLGRIHFLGGRPEEGERYLRLALRRDPQNLDTRKWLARLLLSPINREAGAGEELADEALGLLMAGLEYSVEDAELHALIGRAQRASGKVAAALTSFEQARALYGRAVEIALELADLYQSAGMEARAQSELRRALLLAGPDSGLADWIVARLEEAKARP